MRYAPFLVLAVLALAIVLVVFARQASERENAETSREIITVKEGSGQEQDMAEKEVFVTQGIRHSIPLEEFIVGIGGGSGREAILQDRAPKDAIASIDNPKFESVEAASGWLDEEDPGIAFSQGGVHRFYPFGILVQHEIVNDTLPSGQRVLVTYCPLCLTGFALDPLVQSERVEFGVSGLLRQANLVMYDRKTNSLWLQVLAEAVVGPETGTKLAILPSDVAQYGKWKEQYPQGEVLSRDTGFFGRSYTTNPYGGSYFDVPAASRFFSSHKDDRLAEEAPVLGIVVQGRAKAYNIASVKERGMVQDVFEGQELILRHEPALDVVRMFRKTEDGSEQRISPVFGFWFAWAAAHPDTELYP